MKRKQHVGTAEQSRKKARRATDQSTNATTTGVDHPVLRRLYAQVHTLRHYLLSQIPKSSKGRRRRIDQIGNRLSSQNATTPDLDAELGKLLDSTLVATTTRSNDDHPEQRSKRLEQEVESFTQQRSSDTASGTFKPGYFLQTEVCHTA